MILMLCKICGINETDNPDGICDDCKFSIISSDEIPPNTWLILVKLLKGSITK